MKVGQVGSCVFIVNSYLWAEGGYLSVLGGYLGGKVRVKSMHHSVRYSLLG